MKSNGDFEAADWESRGVKLDGRQTRPANDVGRPDGSAERIAELGRRAFAKFSFEAGWSKATEVCNLETGSSWYAAAPHIRQEAFEAYWREVCEGLRGSEAPHGEAAPDETEKMT